MLPHHEHKRSRFHERFKTLNDIFDISTEELLWKLISAGYIDGLEGPLSMGKEANVFTAKAGDEQRVVKVYRVMTCDFKRMYENIAADPRFLGMHRSRRDVVHTWCQREFRNLLKARAAGCAVPTPFVAKENVLIMECVGGLIPAQKLNKKLPPNLKSFFGDVVKNMRLLYKAGLVHGDLSQFNILNNDDKPVFIDFSQATTKDNPNFEDYFLRDIRNVASFFTKHGVMVTEKELREKIYK